MGRRIIAFGLSVFILLSGSGLLAQNPLGRFGNIGGGGGKGADTLAHRKNDTITINFRYLDSSRLDKLDSSILDFSRKVPSPNTWINLGNMGTPARDLVFTPRMQSGWDPGWHSYDLYLFRTADTKFYNTTKPYTELGYELASHAEQLVDVYHTQNIKPNWNIAFEYRLINAPGSFQNQNSAHNNIRFNSWYQAKNRRYQNFFILISNKINASENGGLQNVSDLENIAFTNQQALPVQLGDNRQINSSNPFSSNISVGTKYSSATFLFRQQYDLGQKDSIVTDSSVIPLFYPRVRLEHTISYNTYNYRYMDYGLPGVYLPDSTYYTKNYGLNYVGRTDTVTGLVADSFYRQDRWKLLSNDFSIYTFPDSKNPQQFLKLGATLELLQGTFDTASIYHGDSILQKSKVSNSNVFAHGEYRNKTRNQKWDIEAFGRLYLQGLDVGDYNVYISLRRLISRQVGYFRAGFENSNRTPGFVYDRASSFNFDTVAQKNKFQKENTIHLFASLEQPQHHLSLSGSYYLLSNYAFFQNYYQERQASTVFNLIQISLKKQFTIYRHWKWRTETVVQQVAGSSPVHVPLLVSFNQVGYDGNFGFKNLIMSFGTEVRYISPYKADGYAPVTDQFFTQSDSTIRQRLPDISLYLHLRIRSFTAYVRMENINSLAFSPNGYGYYHNNFVAPNYPSPGGIFRFGFFWGFIN